jgi:hypothetical protein
MLTAALANLTWRAASAPAAVAFDAALADPARAQEQILRRYLRQNADTAFGQAHGLANVRTPEQFARRVPPRDYDGVRPWVERVRAGEPNVLTAEPVRRLVPTGGSTAGPKLVPYTAGMQAELNRAVGPWMVDLFRRHPGAARGPAYWSVTPAAGDAAAVDDAPTAVDAAATCGAAAAAAAGGAGVRVGFDDDADYLGGWQRHLIAAAMAVPAGLREVRSADAWRYATLLLLLRRRDLALVSVWHPSFWELLLTALAADWDRLLADVACGGCAVAGDLPPAVAAATWSTPRPARARELRQAGPAGGVAALWPRLRVISCWGDAGAAAAADALARRSPGVAVEPKGLLATEGVVSIPYRGRHPLAVRSHYLEFEDDAGGVRPAADLAVGQCYRVLLTTAGGLCRYRLNDVVRVDGHVGRTPSVRFVGRDGVASDRAGEKLTERFVSGVLDYLFAAVGSPRPPFAMLAADVEGNAFRYTLYVGGEASPAWAVVLDALLSRNPQYAYCRRLGQLLAPRVERVGGGAHVAYAARLRQRGQRLGDIKPAALSPLDGWSALLTKFDAR